MWCKWTNEWPQPGTRIATLRICATACSRMHRCRWITFMPCRWKPPIWKLRPHNTPRRSKRLAGSPPVLDLAHLGLGPDGHTASLIPGDPVLKVAEADVALTGLYQGRRRMTLTYPILNRSRCILWLVTGSEKAGMLARLRDGDLSIPAGLVHREQAIVLADRAAAGLGRLAGCGKLFLHARRARQARREVRSSEYFSLRSSAFGIEGQHVESATASWQAVTGKP